MTEKSFLEKCSLFPKWQLVSIVRLHLHMANNCPIQKNLIRNDTIENVYICNTQKYVYHIVNFSFHFVFRSVPFSVPRFSNTKWP